MRPPKSAKVRQSPRESEANAEKGMRVLFGILRRLEWRLERGESPARLLTPRQAAELLAVDERTVRRLVATGNLVAVRFGRSVRLTPDDLAAFVRERRVVQSDEAVEDGSAELAPVEAVGK